MGRFRIFCNDKTISSGEYNEVLNGITTIKHARSKAISKRDENYVIDYDTLEITNFKSYNDYLSLAKAFFLINPDCNLCIDVPINLRQGLMSEICFEETQEHVYNCDAHPCSKCDKILRLYLCREKSRKLYPYGYYNNERLQRHFKFPVRIKLRDCRGELKCPVYSYCKCPAFWDADACQYQVMFPSESKFIYYTEQGLPFIDKNDEVGCCTPVIKEHKCLNCDHYFSPPCANGYHCPQCGYHYYEGHYLTEDNNFNCYGCNNMMKLNPYFECKCNNCDKSYKPHGKYCKHLYERAIACDGVKEKHIHAFSVYPKMKSDSIDIVLNNK